MTSCLVLLNVLTCEKIRYQFFQQLCGVFAVADIIQTSVTFLGDHGHEDSNYTLCSIQNYGLTLGLLNKLATVLVINGVSWFIITHLTIPNNKHVVLSFAIFLACLLTTVGMVLNSSDIYCTDFHYDEASRKKERAADYLLFLFVLTYISFFIIVLFCIAISRKMTAMHFRTGEIEKDMRTLLTRLQIIPLCLTACFVPVTLAFIYIFFRGSVADSIVIDSITGTSISLNGFLTGGFYFYHQKHVCTFLMLFASETPPKDSYNISEKLLLDSSENNHYLGADSQYTYDENCHRSTLTVETAERSGDHAMLKYLTTELDDNSNSND